jgi:DNA repair protein RadC
MNFIPEFEISLKAKGKPSELTQIQSSADVAKVCRDCFNADAMDWREEFIAIALSRSNKVIGFYKVSSGGTSGTVVDPKILFQFALLATASSLIICHNHPSGNLNPSSADNDITKKICEAGKLLDIQVLDHIILTSESYYSFADNGKI